jgi:hypothetical protein
MLEICGIKVRTYSEYPLVDDPTDLAYRQFVTPDDTLSGCTPAVEVQVLASPSPSNDSPDIFDSDIAWRMQREADGYRISFRRNDGDRIHTVMCADHATCRLRVYVHQDEPPARPPSEGLADPVRAPLDQVLFMNHLALRGGVICHSAAAVVDGRALLFPGVSGAGKSTLCRMFGEAGLAGSLLSDDRVILRLAEQGQSAGITAWGTPWHGDALIASNHSAPLAAVLFLVQAPENQVVPISPGQAMRRLMPKISCPWYDADRLPAVLDTCGKIVESIPCFDLHFTRDGSVLDLLAAQTWD